MPLYEYQCGRCGRFEIIHKFSDPPLPACPTCGGEIEKLPSSPAIQFKGTGWYVTDYGKSSGGEGKKDEGKKDEGKKSEGKSSSGGESKGASSSGDSATASKDGSSASGGAATKGSPASGGSTPAK